MSHIGVNLGFGKLHEDLSDEQMYQGELGLAELADRLGYDSLWSVEHDDLLGHPERVVPGQDHRAGAQPDALVRPAALASSTTAVSLSDAWPLASRYEILAGGGAPMRGRAAWRRTLEVKERYLAAGDPDRLPPQSCGVGLEIVQSLRRSLLSGVDAAATDIPRDEAAVPPERLVRAARPVIDRLADQLSGMRARRRCAQGQCGPTSGELPATAPRRGRARRHRHLAGTQPGRPLDQRRARAPW